MNALACFLAGLCLPNCQAKTTDLLAALTRAYARAGITPPPYSAHGRPVEPPEDPNLPDDTMSGTEADHEAAVAEDRRLDEVDRWTR